MSYALRPAGESASPRGRADEGLPGSLEFTNTAPDCRQGETGSFRHGGEPAPVATPELRRPPNADEGARP